MFSRGYKVVSKQRFEVYVDEVDPRDDEAIVKINTGAICKADLRYYLGLRDDKILDHKYPISLIHEAVGTVVKDKTGKLPYGTKVVLCPNVVDAESPKDKTFMRPELGENYSPNARFASSNVDGFSRNFISYRTSNLICIPNEFENNIAVFSELISVACAAVRRTPINFADTIAVWGDGVLGYILSLVLSATHEGRVIVIGSHKEKLEKFHVDQVYFHNDSMINMEKIDIAFECIGGIAAEKGINQIIDLIEVGGKIVLTGVSENLVAINTRKILEKGLSIYGSTRSAVKDFEKAVQLLSNNDFRSKLKTLVLGELAISSISDYYDAFEKEKVNKKLGKYILNFNF